MAPCNNQILTHSAVMSVRIWLTTPSGKHNTELIGVGSTQLSFHSLLRPVDELFRYDFIYRFNYISLGNNTRGLFHVPSLISNWQSQLILM